MRTVGKINLSETEKILGLEVRFVADAHDIQDTKVTRKTTFAELDRQGRYNARYVEDGRKTVMSNDFTFGDIAQYLLFNPQFTESKNNPVVYVTQVANSIWRSAA